MKNLTPLTRLYLAFHRKFGPVWKERSGLDLSKEVIDEDIEEEEHIKHKTKYQPYALREDSNRNDKPVDKQDNPDDTQPKDTLAQTPLIEPENEFFVWVRLQDHDGFSVEDRILARTQKNKLAKKQFSDLHTQIMEVDPNAHILVHPCERNQNRIQQKPNLNRRSKYKLPRDEWSAGYYLAHGWLRPDGTPWTAHMLIKSSLPGTEFVAKMNKWIPSGPTIFPSK